MPAATLEWSKVAPAHEVVPVPQASRLDTTGRQEQTSVLDAAGGEDDGPGFHPVFGAAEGANADSRRPGAVVCGQDLDGILVEIHVDMSGPPQLLTVDLAKTGGRAHLLNLRDHPPGQGKDLQRLRP